MASVASMCMVVALTIVSSIPGPRAASAQEMAPTGGMMMHGTTVEGVITHIRYASCGSTPDSCQAIVQIVPSSASMMQGGQESMPAHPAMTGESMMGPHPVTVIIVPGTALMGQHQNAPLPLTRLHVGDTVACEYRTLGGMNVVTKVTLTGMGHM